MRCSRNSKEWGNRSLLWFTRQCFLIKFLLLFPHSTFSWLFSSLFSFYFSFYRSFTISWLICCLQVLTIYCCRWLNFWNEKREISSPLVIELFQLWSDLFENMYYIDLFLNRKLYLISGTLNIHFRLRLSFPFLSDMKPCLGFSHKRVNSSILKIFVLFT